MKKLIVVLLIGGAVAFAISPPHLFESEIERNYREFYAMQEKAKQEEKFRDEMRRAYWASPEGRLRRIQDDIDDIQTKLGM